METTERPTARRRRLAGIGCSAATAAVLLTLFYRFKRTEDGSLALAVWVIAQLPPLAYVLVAAIVLAPVAWFARRGS